MFCAVQTWSETSVFVCRIKVSRLCPGWKYLNVSPEHPHFIIYYYSFYVGINKAGKILWHLGKNMVLLPQTQLKVLWHIINEINRWTEIRTFCLLKTNLIIPWHLVISIPVFWGVFLPQTEQENVLTSCQKYSMVLHFNKCWNCTGSAEQHYQVLHGAVENVHLRRNPVFYCMHLKMIGKKNKVV